MLTNPLPNNQNMNSRTIDPICALSGNQNLSEAARGHGCINMMSAAKVVTHTKDYGSSQPDLGKEPLLLRVLSILKILWINLKFPLTFLMKS